MNEEYMFLFNLFYKFQSNLNQIPENYFVDIDKLILKIKGKDERSWIANVIQKNKNKDGGLTLLDIKA